MTFQALCESQLPFFNGGATWLRHTENQPPLSGAATSPPRSGRTPERKGLSSLSAFPVPTRTRDESGRSHLPTAVTTSMLWPLWPKWQRTGSVDIHRNNVQSRFSCAWEGMPVMCVLHGRCLSRGPSPGSSLRGQIGTRDRPCGCPVARVDEEAVISCRGLRLWRLWRRGT